MAQTLTELEYLDRDMILKGVTEWIVKESPMLKAMPQKIIQGNSLKYNVEVTLPAASWVQAKDQIVENTGTWEQRSTDIYTMVHDADTDKGAIKLNSTQDPEKANIALGAKAMAHEWENTFIRGQTSTLTNAKQFKGVLRILAELESATTTDLDGINNSQVIDATAGSDGASGALTMAAMDKLVDQIKPGKPTCLLMSRRARRKLNALMRASGSGVIMVESKEFGLFMPSYDGVPIYISDFVPDNIQDGATQVLTIASFNPNTTRASGYDNTVIAAMQIGEDAVTGLHAGEMEHERETFIENYNVIRNRFVWYCGAACFKKFSLAALININPDT